MVDVAIGTDEYVLERSLTVLRDGGAERLARCLADMPEKQTAALIAIKSLGQRTRYLGRALDTGLSLHAEGQTTGAMGRRIYYQATRSGGGTVIFPGGVPGESADFEPSPASPRMAFHGSGRVRTAADRSEANVCLEWKQGGDPTGGYSRNDGPGWRPSDEGPP